MCWPLNSTTADAPWPPDWSPAVSPMHFWKLTQAATPGLSIYDPMRYNISQESEHSGTCAKPQRGGMREQRDMIKVKCI